MKNKRPRSGPSITSTLAIAAGTLVLVVFLLTCVVVSYSVFRNAHKTLKEQSREINKQIVFNYDQYIQSIIQMANYMQYRTLNYDLEQNQQEIYDLFINSADSRSDVFAIALFDEDGAIRVGQSSSTANMPDPQEIKKSLWFYEANKTQEVYHFFSGVMLQEGSTYNKSGFIISHSFRYNEGGAEKMGVLVVEMNLDKIGVLKSLTNLGPYGHILFIDERDMLVYSSVDIKESHAKEVYRRAVREDFGSYTWTIGGRTTEVNINVLPYTRWRIVTSYDVGVSGQVNSQILVILAVILVGSILTAIAIGIAISRRISKPIDELREGMDQIASGSSRRHIEISGQKEIVSLANTFNGMMDEIDNLNAVLLEEQKQKRRTAMIALQNQINPHFLYNTLDSVVWLAEKHQSESVIKMVTALAKFFRISISRGCNIIGVKEELSHVLHYLEIQQIRYLDRISYHFEVDPAVEQYQMVKLLLQPIVENAINYGLTDEPVHIAIRARLEGDLLVFEVENTGYGMTLERIEEVMSAMRDANRKEGVGLKNIYQRIKVMYGARADIAMSSELDEYTRVEMRIPCVVEEHA